MSVCYYGPTAKAELEASELLKLDYLGREQDWELEFASPVLVEPILNLMEYGVVDFEVLSALALLLISSIQEGNLKRVCDRSLQRTKAFMSANPQVRERMQFYWIDLARANDVDLVKKLLSD